MTRDRDTPLTDKKLGRFEEQTHLGSPALVFEKDLPDDN